MKQTRPPINSFYLAVDSVHRIHIEEYGNLSGLPVLFLHGGPGSGCSPDVVSLFDLDFYRLILVDQRGAGKSEPKACVENNTTGALLEDLELLRKRLGIETWILFGGSWGSSLAILYAETYPLHVKALILRGIFLCRKREIDWFYGNRGAALVFPREYAEFTQEPSGDTHSVVSPYYSELLSTDNSTRVSAAQRWCNWESSTSYLSPLKNKTEDDIEKKICIATLECHFLMHNFWMEENQLLKNIRRIKNIPSWIIHGRYDMVSPMSNACDLHKAIPNSHFEIIPNAGHAYDEPETFSALVRSLDAAKLL